MEEFISKSCPDAEPLVKGLTGRDWPLFMLVGVRPCPVLTGRLCLVYSSHQVQFCHARWRRRVNTPSSCGFHELKTVFVQVDRRRVHRNDLRTRGLVSCWGRVGSSLAERSFMVTRDTL